MLAVIVATVLLCSASCAPVHSDRPLGSAPCTSRSGASHGQPSEISGIWLLESPGAVLGTTFVAVLDPQIDLYRVARWKHALDGLDMFEGEPTEVAVRSYHVNGKEWLFFSEEGRLLKGGLLWSLTRQHNDDTFLV